MPSATIAAGVWASGNSWRVAAFTLLSVVCADSITATSSSNAESNSSSVVGAGLAAWRRRKIARRVAACIASVLDASGRLLALGEQRGTLVVARCGPCEVQGEAPAVVVSARRRIASGARHHDDTVDRAGRYAQLTAGALRQQHGVHLAMRTDDRIHRTRR